MIVALDGPAASGKGTLARRLARHFDFAFLDTGLLYRATARHLAGAGLGDAAAEAAARRVRPADLDDPELRREDIAQLASTVAAVPGVRAALLAFQRDFAAAPPDGKRGAVLDGRDIGTVIVPQADVKIFLVASPEERARRRTQELDRRGDKADFEVILADIRSRDERDTNRAVSPLKQAQDAHLLDTTHLDIDAAIRAAIDIVEATRAGRGRG
jgi:CMP/dCMP kinase